MIETDLYHISNEVKEKVHMLKKKQQQKIDRFILLYRNNVRHRC